MDGRLRRWAGERRVEWWVGWWVEWRVLLRVLPVGQIGRWGMFLGLRIWMKCPLALELLLVERIQELFVLALELSLEKVGLCWLGQMMLKLQQRYIPV